MKAKIMVVDDEKSLLELVRDILEDEGFIVVTADTAETGLARIKQSRPDLILLDVRLPSIGGLEMCRRLKADTATRPIPVIMLTVQSAEVDKVIGFEAGADDYVTKPFSKAELLARVKAVLRRVTYGKPATKTVKAGLVSLDAEKRQVLVRGKEVRLRPKEFDLLQLLLDRRGQVLTRTFLTETVMGYQYFGTTRTVDTHVKTLRQKLGPAGDLIETVPAVGYRFTDAG